MNEKKVASELLRLAKSFVSVQYIPWQQELIDALGSQFEHQPISNDSWAIFKYNGKGGSSKALTIAEDLIDRAKLGDMNRIEAISKGKNIELHINR